jgi:hypothetical protein
MTREAIKPLFTAIGLALLLTVGTVPHLHAAPLSRRASSPGKGPAVQTITASSLTVTPTPPPPGPSPIDTIITLGSENGLVIAGACLILLLFLSLALVISVLRRKRAKPPTTVPSAPATPPRRATGPYLESVHTTGSDRRFALRPEGVTVGRSPENDLVITQDFPGWETVSQRHAWIYQWVNRWIIEDISSTNGIHVNGRRTGRNLLRDGWQLDIGGVEFVFRANAEEAGQ